MSWAIDKKTRILTDEELDEKYEHIHNTDKELISECSELIKDVDEYIKREEE